MRRITNKKEVGDLIAGHQIIEKKDKESQP